MNHFNSCSPKSVWYYITGVNVHIKFISFFFAPFFFCFEDIFMLRSLRQVSRPAVFLLFVLLSVVLPGVNVFGA